MKIYLAAPYPKKDRMRIYAASLEMAGHTVTSEWITSREHDNGIDGVNESTFDRDKLWAETALRNIREADVFLFFSEPAESMYTRGGRHVEFGYALYMKMPIISIGGLENIFHTMPNVFCVSSFQAAEEIISTMAIQNRSHCTTEVNS